MNYREQLQQEINQAESQLKKLEKSERSKMRERNNLNKLVLAGSLIVRGLRLGRWSDGRN